MQKNSKYMSRIGMAIVIIAAFPLAGVQGQHRIITLNDDTIHCRIVSITSSHIRYEQRINGRTAGRFIPIEEVTEYSREGGNVMQMLENDSNRDFKSASTRQRWRIGVHGGGAYLVASADATRKSMQEGSGISKKQTDEYIRKFRNGLYLGGDVHYMLTDFFGVGAHYSMFRSSVDMELIMKIDNGNHAMGEVFYPFNDKERNYMHYAGPSAVFIHPLGNGKFAFSEELTVGCAYLRQEFYGGGQSIVLDHSLYEWYPNILTDGYTLGAGIRVAMEYYIVPSVSVGINAGFFSAIFSYMNVQSAAGSVKQKLEGDEKISMSNFNYSAGVRFHF